MDGTPAVCDIPSRKPGERFSERRCLTAASRHKLQNTAGCAQMILVAVQAQKREAAPCRGTSVWRKIARHCSSLEAPCSAAKAR